MTYFFWGFLLVMIDLSLTFGSMTVNFLPTFLGYLLLYGGCRQHDAHSPQFHKAALPCIIGAAVTGIVFVLDLLGKGSTWAELICLLIYCWASYLIIAGIQDLEHSLETDLNAGKLHDLWVSSLGFSIAGTVMLLAGLALELLLIVALVLMLVALVLEICFLVKLWNSKERYDHLAD